MRIAVIGEGETEYRCLPTIAGRMGNVVVGQMIVGTNGEKFDWALLIEKKVVPRVLAMAERAPDKIVVAVDREGRDECPPELAAQGLQIIRERCGHRLGGCAVALVVSNRRFENTLFADYEAVDSLPILSGPVSHLLPTETDGHNVLGLIRGSTRPGACYDKELHGAFLARRIRVEDEGCLKRSRTLQKLVKEFRGA